jgi:hypothetical protein
MKDHAPHDGRVPRSRGDQLALLAKMFGEPTPQGEAPLQSEPKDAAKRAREAHFDAFDTARREAQRAGVRIDGESALSKLHSAGHRYAEVWERRTRVLERTLGRSSRATTSQTTSGPRSSPSSAARLSRATRNC